MVTKFHIYDIVEITKSFWRGELNESQEDVGKLAVISKISDSGNGYEIRRMENGYSSAWWHDDQLKLIGRAKVDIFEQLDEKQHEFENKTTDLLWIAENYDKGVPLSSEIVRCRHCKHYNLTEEDISLGLPGMCNNSGMITSPDDYCSGAWEDE